MRTRECVVVAVLLLWPTAIFAQTVDAFAQGGLSLPYQSGVTGESFQTYRAAPGGMTFGWSVGGGVFLGPRVGIDFSIARTGEMSARQHSRYNASYDDTRRDLFLAAGLRFRTSLTRLTTLEPVVGVTLIDSTATVGAPGSASRQVLEIQRRPGLTVGGDLHVGHSQVGMLLSMRTVIDTLTLDHTQFGWYPSGYPRITWIPSVGVRISAR